MRLAGKYKDKETLLDPDWEQMFTDGGVEPVYCLGYACFTRRKRGLTPWYKKEFVHALIMNHKSNNKFVIDHINGNKLDNRRTNLRIVPFEENAKNREHVKHNSNNKLGAVGVFKRKDTGKFVVQLKLNYKLVYRKEFKNFEDARAVAEFNNQIRNK